MSSSPPRTSEPEDIFTDSLESLYGYAPFTLASLGSVFHYELTDARHRLHQSSSSHGDREQDISIRGSTITVAPPDTAANNWSLQASSVWASSVFLADHLDDLHLDQHLQTVRRRGQDRLRILELGAGAGLPSIVIARCFVGADVTVSDYPDPQLIRGLQANVDANDVAERCRVVPYAWGSSPSVFSRHDPVVGVEDCAMDVIIAADTLWKSEMHSPFLQSLQLLLRRTSDARIYLIAGLHTGRYTLQSFIDSVEGYGFELDETVEREVSGCCQRAWNVDRAEGEDDKERRRWLLWIKLKRREAV